MAADDADGAADAVGTACVAEACASVDVAVDAASSLVRVSHAGTASSAKARTATAVKPERPAARAGEFVELRMGHLNWMRRG
jgi:hypothetical protein